MIVYAADVVVSKDADEGEACSSWIKENILIYNCTAL